MQDYAVMIMVSRCEGWGREGVSLNQLSKVCSVRTNGSVPVPFTGVFENLATLAK